MSRIDDLIDTLAPNGVELKTLGHVGEFVRGNGLQKSDLTEDGTAAIHYGQVHTLYGTWTDQTKSFTDPGLAAKLRRAKPGDLIIATTSEDDAAVAKATAWIGIGEVAVSGDAYIYRHSLDPRYVSYFFQSNQFQSQKARYLTGTKVRRISGDSLAKIRIPVPPLEAQQEIARILDKYSKLKSELEVELNAELKARRIQYEHYRSILTSTVNGEPRTLDQIFDMRSGKFIAASNISATPSDTHMYPCYGGNGLRGYVTTFNQDGNFVLVGRQGALSGNTKRVSGKFYATEHAVVVTPRDASIDVDWAFFKLTNMNLNQYVSKGAQPGLAVGTLKALEVRVPSVADQLYIAMTLRNLHAFMNELNTSIPAELAARRKQYEYYRDCLLTFEEIMA